MYCNNKVLCNSGVGTFHALSKISFDPHLVRQIRMLKVTLSVLLLSAISIVLAFSSNEVGSRQRNDRIMRVWTKDHQLSRSELVTLTGIFYHCDYFLIANSCTSCSATAKSKGTSGLRGRSLWSVLRILWYFFWHFLQWAISLITSLGQYLSVEELAKFVAASDDAVETVSKFFESMGRFL